MTLNCDFTLGVYSVTTITDIESVLWPWVTHPTLEELKEGISDGFIGDQPKAPCSWFRSISTTTLAKRVYKCSLPITTNGVVTDPNYKFCDLKQNHTCISSAKTGYFRPDSNPMEYKGCPITLDNIDLGILEAGKEISARTPVTLTATKTKRQFYWSNESSAAMPSCNDVSISLPVYQDDGGYLVSFETLTGYRIDPVTITSSSYLQSIGEPRERTKEALEQLYQSYVTKFSLRLSGYRRHQRSTNTTSISPIQSFLLQLVDNNLSSRSRRDLNSLSHSFNTPISDLQMSYLRAEIQHDFSTLTDWVNNKMRTIYKWMCENKQREWFKDTLNASPPSVMVKYLSGDPYATLMQSRTGGPKVCTPMIPSSSPNCCV